MFIRNAAEINELWCVMSKKRFTQKKRNRHEAVPLNDALDNVTNNFDWSVQTGKGFTVTDISQHQENSVIVH